MRFLLQQLMEYQKGDGAPDQIPHIHIEAPARPDEEEKAAKEVSDEGGNKLFSYNSRENDSISRVDASLGTREEPKTELLPPKALSTGRRLIVGRGRGEGDYENMTTIEDIEQPSDEENYSGRAHNKRFDLDQKI